MRYQKTVTTDGVETARYDYVYSDGKLILLTYTANGVSNTARFIYDSWGEPRGFILNNTAAYIYLKNAQGDITAIVDENGEVLLTYTYTAWGKVTYSATSMESLALAATLSNVNPFTYRGYCYDYDIGMYYLQSRYYDPEICRFINADSTDYLGATGTLLSYNLFAYCENDGVNYIDTTGTWGKSVHYSDTLNWAKNAGFNSTEAKIIAEADQGMDNIKNHAFWINNQHIHFNTNINGIFDSREIFAATCMIVACIIWSESYDSYIKQKKEAEKNLSGIKKHNRLGELFEELEYNKGSCIKMIGNGLHAIQDIEGHGQIEPTIELLGYTYTQHLVSSNNAKKNKADNTWYSWTNNERKKLHFDITRERYNTTKRDSEEYLKLFLDFRNSIYSGEIKKLFSKSSYQFRGYAIAPKY